MACEGTVDEKNLFEFFIDMKPIFTVSFVPNNERTLLTGTQDGIVSSWDLNTCRRERNCSIKSGPMQCMAIRFCGNDLLTQDKSGSITCWQKAEESWKVVKEVTTDYFGFCKLDTLDDMISCPQRDAAVKVYDNKLNEIISFKPDGDKLGSVNFCKLVTLDGDRYVLVGYENAELMLWNVKTCDMVNKLTLKSGVPLAVDFDEDERMGIVGFTSKRLVILKIDVLLEISRVSSIKLNSEGVNSIRIHKTTGVFAVGCWDSYIKLFSWPSGQYLSALQFHSKSVEDICFSKEKIYDLHEGYLLAACSSDSKLSVWTLPDKIIPSK